MKHNNDLSESGKFDAAIRQIFTVSKSELKRREDEWKKQKAAKKQAKSKA